MKNVMRWVSVEEKLPRKEMPTLLWGSSLGRDDFPLAGRLCSHCGRFLSDDAGSDINAESITEMRLGVVTHWLDWTIPEGAE